MKPSVLAHVIMARDVQMGLSWYQNTFPRLPYLNRKLNLHCNLKLKNLAIRGFKNGRLLFGLPVYCGINAYVYL